jgi:hypothetical protein
MKTIQIDGHNFIAGMKWSQLSGESLKAEVSAYASENSCKYGVIRKINNDGVSRIQLGMLAEKVNKPWSAAGVLADIYPNIILVDYIDDAYWICAISGGLVLPGGDLFVKTAEDASNKVDDLINLINGEPGEMVFAISDSISDDLEVVGTLNKTFSELIDGHEKSYGQHNQVISLKGIPRPLVLGGVFMLVCGGLLYALMPSSSSDVPQDDFSDLTEMTLPGNVKFSASEMASGVISTSASEEKLLDAAKQEELMWLTEDFNANNSKVIVSNFVNLYASIPSEVSGWQKNGADFDTAEPEKLNVIWNKTYGTGLMLKNSLTGKNVSVAISIDGKKGSVFYKIPKIEKGQITDIQNFIKNSDYKKLSITNDLDLSGISWTATKHTDTSRPIAIEGIKDKNIAITRQLRSNITDMKIEGKGLNNLILASEILDRAKTFLTTRLVIQSENQSWVVYGALYE